MGESRKNVGVIPNISKSTVCNNLISNATNSSLLQNENDCNNIFLPVSCILDASTTETAATLDIYNKSLNILLLSSSKLPSLDKNVSSLFGVIMYSKKMAKDKSFVSLLHCAWFKIFFIH